MQEVARSLEKGRQEAQQADRDLRVEIAAILLFLPGLVFLVASVVCLATVLIFSEEAGPASGGPFLPDLGFSFWPVLMAVLVFLIPAALFMSAGVVLRRFLRS